MFTQSFYQQKVLKLVDEKKIFWCCSFFFFYLQGDSFKKSCAVTTSEVKFSFLV